MNSHHEWLLILNATVQGMVTIMTIAVVFIGWTRQRRVGFLVLMAWGMAVLFSIFGNALLFAEAGAAAGQFLQHIFPKASPVVFIVLPGMIVSLVSSLLLLCGLALLVFRPQRTLPRG